MNMFSKVFGTRSQREVKRIMPLVEKIESLRPDMQKLSDEELRGKTREFKKRLEEGETLDDLLPEAFAVVREAGKRVLGMEHFRVQLIGGIILHQGRIAEMRTGEGKTLVATLPSYLNALEGKGVHVVTVNDYLAKRDAEEMGKIHEFLGLTVGVVLNDMKQDERRAAYNCDVTYVTNNELGFDYLRDNMVIYKEQLVQRDLHYCIIDEVDSILIDEARTPLIISGQSGKSTKLYEACDILAQQLERGEASHEMTKMAAIMGEEVIETGDFVVNEKDKIVNLTEQGVHKVEKFFHIENLADPENLEIQHNITLALRAHNLMHKDQDYVVKDDEILIVDEFTGRIMPGRRYSDGLHQAIEAKEHVKIKRESKTLATITFQNFFNKYDKKGGMTGTAVTEEKEFRDIYAMDVVEIPTNRPVIRVDHEDAVYMTKKEKFNAVSQNIYNDYVLPLKIESSTGESVGPSKYSKLLAYILPTNRFSGTFSGSGKITIDGTSQSTSVGSAKLYASSINTCYMYVGNTNQDTDPNYKDYAINLSFDEKEHITLTARNVELELEPITNTLTRKYVLHDTDTRYYVQTSVLYLKYKYKDLTEGERRTIVYEGTHTQIKNVLISDYPNVKVEEE